MVVTLDQRAALAAIVALPDPPGRFGHRLTQPRDVVKAWRAQERAASVYLAARRQEFARVVRFATSRTKARGHGDASVAVVADRVRGCVAPSPRS